MQQESQSRLRLPVSDRDHRQGPNDAPATLVEYGDYECPFCGEAYPIVKRVQQELGDDLQFVFRNFPLTTAHPHAEQAAEAAESAGAQGKFWEMHDALYENQSDLSTEGLIRIATSVGVDKETLIRDLSSRTFEDRVYEDFMSGVRSGVNGTPTFFINGIRYDGRGDFQSLVAVLRAAAGANE
jgi:protein-disulfide isomerase